MLDELFFKKGLERHKIDYVFFGFAVTILGFVLAVVFFGANSSAAQVLTISLFLTPAILRLLRKEEMLARKEGVKHIYRNHKNIFEIYTFILIGVFVAYLSLLSGNVGESAYSQEDRNNRNPGEAQRIAQQEQRRDLKRLLARTDGRDTVTNRPCHQEDQRQRGL